MKPWWDGDFGKHPARIIPPWELSSALSLDGSSSSQPWVRAWLLGLEQLIRLGLAGTIPAPSAALPRVPAQDTSLCSALGTSFPIPCAGFHHPRAYKCPPVPWSLQGAEPGSAQPSLLCHEGHRDPGAPGTGSSVPGMWVTPGSWGFSFWTNTGSSSVSSSCTFQILLFITIRIY